MDQFSGSTSVPNPYNEMPLKVDGSCTRPSFPPSSTSPSGGSSFFREESSLARPSFSQDLFQVRIII